MNKASMKSSCPLNKKSRCHSQAIPMPRSHVPRTDSELQLYEDMNAAEWKELAMFHRVVKGIRERQSYDIGAPIESNYNVNWIKDDRSVRLQFPSKPVEKDACSCVKKSQPQDHQHPSFLQQQTTCSILAANDDEWSICGFEQEPVSVHLTNNNFLPIVEDDDDDVFDMEL